MKNNQIFHKNSWSGSQVFPCGRTDGQTGMTKLIVAFHDFANAPKIVLVWSSLHAL
jgi:hypothetical protein